MRVAEHDAGPHFDQTIHEHQAAVEHLLVDQYGAAALRRHHQGDADEVRREARPRHVVDLRHHAIEIRHHDKFLIGRHDDVLAIVLPVDTKAPVHDARHAVFLRMGVDDAHAGAGGGRETDQRAHLHVVRPDVEAGAVQRLHAFDNEVVSAYAVDASAHGVQATADVLYMRFHGGVGNGGRACRQHRGEDGLFGAGDAHLVQEQIPAAQALGAQHMAVVLGSDLRSHRLQRQQMGVQAAPANAVAAGAGNLRPSEARQERAGEQHRGADASAQDRVRQFVAHISGVERTGIGDEAGRHADALEHRELGADIADVRHVADSQRPVGQHRRRQQRQRRVLIAHGADSAGEPMGAFNAKVVHAPTTTGC